MNTIYQLLDIARHHIDGGIDCRTHEYHALNHIEQAVRLLAERAASTETLAKRAANEASCLANGILPD